MIPPIVLGAVAILLLALRVIAATGRRSFLRAALVGLLLAAAASSVDAPPPVLGESGSTWVTAWGRTPLSTTVTTASTSVQATVPSQISNQTLRLITWTTIGGSQVKVKFTNRFSTSPLIISAAHVALRQSGGTIAAGSDRTLTFGGGPSVTIPAGAEAWSDAAVLDVPAHADLAISMYLPGTFTPKTFHPTGLKTSYLSPTGNFVSSATMPVPSGSATKTTTQVLFASEVQVLATGSPQTIVAIGDSITDGACSNTNTNGSWPDLLSARMPALADGTPVSIVNAGIGSNRFGASDGAGLSGLHRLPDVLALPQVKWVVFFEGINDISYEHATSAAIIESFQDGIVQAHAAGVRVIGVPILPIKHSTKDVGNNEVTRQAVNDWIRTSGAYDGIIDFEPVMADPADPLSMKSSLTCDHVHPNQAGYAAMANSVSLTLFDPAADPPTPSPTATMPAATDTPTPVGSDSDGDGYSDALEVSLGQNPNSYCTIMRADVNGDGEVNSGDLLETSFGFFPNFMERSDQNGDGEINSGDLLLVSLQFAFSVDECP